LIDRPEFLPEAPKPRNRGSEGGSIYGFSGFYSTLEDGQALRSVLFCPARTSKPQAESLSAKAAHRYFAGRADPCHRVGRFPVVSGSSG